MSGIDRPRFQRHRLGLIGGMSWRSTALYYERLNRAIERECGAHHSFVGEVRNLDYAGLLARVEAEDWTGIDDIVTEAARGLVRARCEIIALTAVTAHTWYDSVRVASGVPVPHVLAGASRELERLRYRKLGILGTSITCSSTFLGDYLGGQQRDLVLVDAKTQSEIDYLIQGILNATDNKVSGRAILERAIKTLASRGAEVVVLACTELPLLLPLENVSVPLIDSVALHVDDICNHILSDDYDR